jgi:hypothetical protein
MHPTTIPPDRVDRLINSIPASFKQAHRLVAFLANNPRSVTVEVNRACAVGNLSDVAHKVNPILYREGYFIGCEKPARPIPNRFGDPSNMYEWSVFKLPQQQDDGVLIA